MDKAPEVFDRLLEITVLLQKDLARSFETNGLTLSRTHLLWELHRLSPSTQQRLATALQVSPRNVTGLVDALEGSGYLARSAHPTDRRTTLVSLTELGETTMAHMEQGRRQLAADLVSDLDAAQVEDFARTLDTVTERLRRLVAAADYSGPDRLPS